MDGPPQKRSRKVAPEDRKARDKARQRKIASNGSDKASRKTAPRIKARDNRKVRRGLDADLRHDPLAVTEADAKSALITRDRHWGSTLAADHRAAMAEERAWLDANAPEGRKGRGRWGDELNYRRTGVTREELMQRVLDRLTGGKGT